MNVWIIQRHISEYIDISVFLVCYNVTYIQKFFT